MARTAPFVFSTRLPKVEATAFRAFAKKLNMSPAVVLRHAVALASKAESVGGTVKDPEAFMNRLADMLEIDRGNYTAILEAVESIKEEIENPDAPAGDADPLASAADPKPAQLSKTELSYCAKHGLSAAQFSAKKAGSVRNAAGIKPARAAAPAAPAVDVPAAFTKAELALFEREHVPPDERRTWLAARKAASVRRAT